MHVPYSLKAKCGAGLYCAVRAERALCNLHWPQSPNLSPRLGIPYSINTCYSLTSMLIAYTISLVSNRYAQNAV